MIKLSQIAGWLAKEGASRVRGGGEEGKTDGKAEQ